MAWLQDDGEENEFSQFEEEDGEGAVEEIEEEVIVTERPGAVAAPLLPALSARPKPRKKAKARSTRRAKPRPKRKKAVGKKKTAKARKGSKAPKRSKARRRR